jgi:hypothetical protein
MAEQMTALGHEKVSPNEPVSSPTEEPEQLTPTLGRLFVYNKDAEAYVLANHRWIPIGGTTKADFLPSLSESIAVAGLYAYPTKEQLKAARENEDPLIDQGVLSYEPVIKEEFSTPDIENGEVAATRESRHTSEDALKAVWQSFERAHQELLGPDSMDPGAKTRQSAYDDEIVADGVKRAQQPNLLYDANHNLKLDHRFLGAVVTNGRNSWIVLGINVTQATRSATNEVVHQRDGIYDSTILTDGTNQNRIIDKYHNLPSDNDLTGDHEFEANRKLDTDKSLRDAYITDRSIDVFIAGLRHAQQAMKERRNLESISRGLAKATNSMYVSVGPL